MKANSLHRAYYPALDGLRGLAILFVLFYHNFGYVRLFEFGWLGVDLFFVLSGFLITDILLQARGTKNFLKNFYIRRVLRIFPIYYLCLFLFLVVFPRISQINFDMTYYENNQGWLWMYLQNWLYIAKQTPNGASHLQHFWSLAVEEQFYMVWPLVVLLLKKNRHLIIFLIGLLALVLGTRILLWVNHIDSLSYFNLYTFSRIDGLCIGCMLSILRNMESNFIRNNMKRIIIGLVVVNIGFLAVKRILGLEVPYLASVGYLSLAILFGMLVYKAVSGEGKQVFRYFDNRYLKFFGKISYSLYIFHWPLYLILYPYVDALFRHFVNEPGLPVQLLGSLICTVMGVIISILSYRYFESFFLKLKKRFA